MNLIPERLDTINEILMQDMQTVNNIGLLNGKLGVSIYFFHLARETENELHQEFAEKLVDEVYTVVSRGHTPPDFENGLAGIAWGIEYLVHNGFVEADTDTVLSDPDDRIYRHIVTAKDLQMEVQEGIMGYMLYILARLQGKDISVESSQNYIFKRLLIELVNDMGDLIEEGKCNMREPYLFDISWDFPICLILLAKVRDLNIYNSKINRILEHLSPIVLSLFPRLISNRLYLLLGMEHVLQQIDLSDWRKHVELLSQHIQLTDILNGELKDKNLHLTDGIAGVAFITRQLYQLTGNEHFLFKNEDLIKKITTSEYWEDLKYDELKRKGMGLLYGLAGIGMELLELSKIESKVLRN